MELNDLFCKILSNPACRFYPPKEERQVCDIKKELHNVTQRKHQVTQSKAPRSETLCHTLSNSVKLFI